MLRAMIFRPFRAGTVIRLFPGRCPGLCYFAPFRHLADEPGLETGLRVRSQVMADKPVTVCRERIGRRIGRLPVVDIARVNVALAFVMGLAD